jgi:hypothetical protein
MIFISALHHFFKLAIQEDISSKMRNDFPSFYAKYRMEPGHFEIDSSTYEKEMCLPGEADAYIHGIIKNYYLGDLIFNSAKNIRSCMRDLFDMVFAKVAQVVKAVQRIAQLRHGRRKDNFRITDLEEAKLHDKMYRALTGGLSNVSTSLNASIYNTSNSHNDSTFERTTTKTSSPKISPTSQTIGEASSENSVSRVEGPSNSQATDIHLDQLQQRNTAKSKLLTSLLVEGESTGGSHAKETD